jgi:HK97 family phage major capsid protein
LSGADIDNLHRQGIINASGIVEIDMATTQKVTNISYNTIADIIGSLDTAFDSSSSVAFAMSKYTLTALRKLKTTDGYPLYAELRGKSPTLWGYPVIGTTSSVLVQNAATDVALKPSIIFGDWSKYRVVRRKGLTIEIGYNTDDFQKGKKSIKSDSRFGGRAEFGEAFIVLNNGPAS